MYAVFFVLMYLASLFAVPIITSCAFLVWVGFTKLTFQMMFCNAVLIRLVYSA